MIKSCSRSARRLKGAPQGFQKAPSAVIAIGQALAVLRSALWDRHARRGKKLQKFPPKLRVLVADTWSNLRVL